MDQMTNAMLELADLDALSKLDSAVHRRHPLVKLLVTIAYIMIVVSFSKDQLSALIPMVLYPVLLFQLSGISMRVCFYKMRFILPLVCAVGIWNPILDRQVVMQLGALSISSGMISFVTLLLKGVFSLMASFLLIATTNIEQICYALSMLKIPDVLVTQLLITYRYISLLLKEAGTMMNAYSLRAPGQKGLHFSAWGSFVGQLLIRSMDRSQNLYQSMQMRGFTGSFYYARESRIQKTDIGYLLGWILFFLLLRYVNLSVLIGNLFV
ncbi:MAG: cobalt ECF transporter T component CbiQ [Clostridiales bacterium]|nr:cobalt ECF transporter T component CbiQ [Candidatus Blautia equi]